MGYYERSVEIGAGNVEGVQKLNRLSNDKEMKKMNNLRYQNGYLGVDVALIFFGQQGAPRRTRRRLFFFLHNAPRPRFWGGSKKPQAPSAPEKIYKN